MWINVFMCIYRGEPTSYTVAATQETASKQENDLFERSASTLQYCGTRLYSKIVLSCILLFCSLQESQDWFTGHT